jgi:hypothetical protein
VAEGVDDWTDMTYVLCNNTHSQFFAEKGDIVGKRLKTINNVDIGPAIEFIGVCKGKFILFCQP